MNDNQLDELIMLSVKRHKAVEKVNRGVMRQLRVRKSRRWLRLALVAFGVPAALISVVLACWYVVTLCPGIPGLKVCMAIPVIAMLILTRQALSKISLSRV